MVLEKLFGSAKENAEIEERIEKKVSPEVKLYVDKKCGGPIVSLTEVVLFLVVGISFGVSVKLIFSMKAYFGEQKWEIISEQGNELIHNTFSGIEGWLLYLFPAVIVSLLGIWAFSLVFYTYREGKLREEILRESEV